MTGVPIIELDGGLFVSEIIGDQSGEQVIEEVGWASMPGVLYLKDVFELVNNGFADRSFSKQKGIHDRG